MTLWAWALFSGAVALGGAGYAIWRKWIAPWSELETLVRAISEGKKPRTFLISGTEVAGRIGLTLENLSTRQQTLRQQLVERTSGTETIAAAMQDGLLVVDRERRIKLANRAFQELFGLSESVPSVPLLEVVRQPDVDRLISDAIASGQPQRRELELSEAPNRSARFIQLSAVTTIADSGAINGAVVLFHDISELKRSDEVRRDFVANVSHELRTPLSILRGYIETLLEDPDLSPAELNRILEVMKKHSDRLTALTGDLLSLARLESAHSSVRLQEVRLSELFAAIVRDWGTRFAEKKMSIDVGLSPFMPNIQADPTRLQEVLYNLLDNAVKYSHAGGRIRLEAVRRDENIEISVSDTGIGIPEADLPRIFERFYRADKARSREHGGTGLGLSIVKHIVQMHGGTVEAASTPSAGTKIRVILPLGAPNHSGSVTET